MRLSKFVQNFVFTKCRLKEITYLSQAHKKPPTHNNHNFLVVKMVIKTQIFHFSEIFAFFRKNERSYVVHPFWNPEKTVKNFVFSCEINFFIWWIFMIIFINLCLHVLLEMKNEVLFLKEVTIFLCALKKDIFKKEVFNLPIERFLIFKK